MYKDRIIKIPENKSTFLFGVRGSGKTSLLNRLYPEALHIDLLNESLYQSYLSNIGLFYEEVNAFREDGLVIVDEIQKMPQLLSEVHRLIESSNRWFILTGSSARKIKAKGVNLLGGRAGQMFLHPFIPEELGKDFNLDQALRYGLLPIVWFSPDRSDKLKDYAETYLKEEIKAEALVRNLPAFTRFLEVAALYHGQIVNMSAVARDSQTSRNFIRNFFSILEDTMLGFFLPAYQAKLRVKEKKSNKFYLIDPGLVRALKKNFSPVSTEEKGFLFEGLIAQILRAYGDYRGIYKSMYYWSSSEAKKTEVDFLLKREKDLIAIEVKAKPQVSSQDYRGLKAISKLPDVKRRIVVYLGNTIRKTEEGIEIWPFDFFCKNLKENFESPVVYEKKRAVSQNLSLMKENIFVESIEKNPKLNLSDFQIPPLVDGELFEKLCLDLYKVKFGDRTQRNGRQGQSQDGVDIFVPDQNIGIQCKKKDFDNKITDLELQKEVQKAKNFKPPLQRFILATTCKRDAKIQEVARLISEDHKNQKLFSVEIHSWDEIRNLLREHYEIYEKYYLNFQKIDVQDSINPAIISSIKIESRHQELNRIRDLINNDKPKTALELLEDFKREKWEQLENKEKYRVLTNMAWAKIRMREDVQASELLIEALHFNREDENANGNCALAYLIIGDIKNSKKYIEKTKQLNSLNITAYILEIKIKDKEKQSLKNIVSAIPEHLKTKYQIAHILSQISIERKQYAEAEKWLNIFYNTREQDKGWKDIMDEATYADISLRLILAKQDVLSGRHVPDNLKHKIEEIIKIYKKLVTCDKYRELKKFNPNWYLHYALALELNGKLSDAIFALQIGIQNFPNDNHLKIELGRLLMQKGNIAESISVLEKQLGLYSVPSENSLDSVNEKPLVLNPIEISENLFNLVLILVDLYFHSKQLKKAQELLHKIEKDSSISESDRLEARQYWIFRLINFGKVDKAEEILNPLLEKDKDNILNLILKSKIENAKERVLEKKAKDSRDHKDKKIQYLKKAYNIFKYKQYDEEANQHNFYFENKERLRDIQHLFEELYYSKMYREAEPLLEEITNKNLNHPKIFKLLHIYFENGKNKLAIELAETLLKKFPHRIESVNTLFLIYESLGDKKKAIQYYESFLKLNPKNNFIRIELALAYIQSEHISQAKGLLKNEFNLNQLSAEQISRLSFAYMRTGNIKKALETQYKCVRNDPRKLESQRVYFELFTFLNRPDLSDIQNFGKKSGTLKSIEHKQDDTSFLCPEKVGIDCYIRIKNIESLEETELSIGEGEAYLPNDEFSQELLGRKKGDVILFNDKKYKILGITSKYVHKYQEILKEAEKRFASKAFLQSVHIPKGADAKEILQTLEKKFPDMSKQREGLNKFFQFYSEGRATIGSIAKISGNHPIEIIGELLSLHNQKDKFISASPEWENDKKTQELLNKKTDVFIDLSSLIMIHLLKIEKYIEKSKFNLYICQSILDSLKEYIQRKALHSKDGLLKVGFDKEGNFGKSFIHAEIIKKDLNFCMEIKAWAEKHCQIKPISTDIILNREEKQSKEKLLGKEFLDPLLATGKNAILLCEDALLRRFAELEYSVSGVRLFDLIEYFERQVIIDSNQAVKFKAQLVQLNQTYIPIDHNILLYLLKEAKYSVNDFGFQRGLFFLSPISDLPGVVNVVAKFLTEICQAQSLLLYNKQVITKEVLDKASFGRVESPKKIAYQIVQLVQAGTQFLPILQNEICRYIIEWLKGKIY